MAWKLKAVLGYDLYFYGASGVSKKKNKHKLKQDKILFTPAMEYPHTLVLV